MYIFKIRFLFYIFYNILDVYQFIIIIEIEKT